ncbi:Putative uncharacterized protein [Moritella viscosa]|uniref:Uncharacterized protein n=1 Tax=Moritella viscosa TaxID=80854 RepID=A0A1L0DT49_9GAMM|nr:Putative uncharacterized protein [Moritella viscosa]
MGKEYASSPDFLSCLYGSEHPATFAPHWDQFLSCLYGSELSFLLSVSGAGFLSCLYGSERKA